MAVCKDCIYFKDFCSIQGMNRNARTDCFKFKDKARFIELPCKVGDTVYTHVRAAGWYYREKNMPYRAKVCFIGLSGPKPFINVVFENENVLQFEFSDIGKTVFLTREAAEKALKEGE